MDTRGQHLLVEFWECDPLSLNNPEYLEFQLKKAAKEANTTVSGVVVIQESHLSIHTWPEVGYAAVDFYTCGEGDPWKAHSVLKNALISRRVETLLIGRGLGPDTSCKITRGNSPTQIISEAFENEERPFFTV